ncbi:hypothetical protein A1O1_07515 [Capronia coronata CBS 617.96]|uniref:Protein PBN1 n=1 Tax=Capronia coronata CBS 617.96 TaxID=1182541 RepID=W9Y3W7_9EURO|nr:uncharacterized protein A1O1_07515 [Capronia coronata CBS 617.96]EXJ83886.1 hypothetical protein A1O1_07515 [Capronia coronata CBS 617.96]
MRRRSTYITHPSRAVNPADIQVYKNQLLLGALKAAREERLTLGLQELPQEVVEVLKESHELHVRWAPEHPYNTTVPFLSRISPGLHVQYTPLKEKQPGHLCDLIHKVFGQNLRCESPQSTFTSPPLISERFAQTASLQYYSLLSSLRPLAAYLQRNVCTPSDLVCLHTATLLNIADSVDLDYDSISHTLTLTVMWSRQPDIIYDPIGEFTTLDAWNLDIEQKGSDKVEVGILSPGPGLEPSDLQLSGFLTVVGEDDHPKATLFSFPSRHHALSRDQAKQQRYNVSFDKPTGLHPILRISFPSANLLTEPENKPSGSVCALQTYLTLPSHIFADKYAFLSNDPLFQKSHNLGQLRSIIGETDLEAPDYVVKKWGSTVLLELQTPNSTVTNHKGSVDGPWDVTVPLHLRYLEPKAGGTSEIEVPWPIVFWACTAEDGTKFPVNPFDRTQLGYDGLFGPRTMFYHLNPAPQNGMMVERIAVPVLDTDTASPTTIEYLTVVSIALGFLWVLFKLRSAFRPASMNVEGKSSDVGKKKQ